MSGMDVSRPLDWTADALCTQYPAELWFPETKGQNAREAKSVCAQCPVAAQCLDLALAYESGAAGTDTSYAAQGIWGGLSPRERMALRRTTQEPAA